jgi:diguanylate cyclase (GGDEF)-like protein
LALFDLDHFKQVNDQHGHSCGDSVLREAARALADGVRDSDVVARLGGDEFALLLRVADVDSASRVVERVRRSVEQAVADAQLPPVTASAGFSLGVPRGEDATAALFEAADSALREAKAEGRDRSVFCAASAKGGSQ